MLTFLSRTEVWVGALGLAAFLTLFWVLRGAPLGQAVETRGRRGRARGAAIATAWSRPSCVGLLLILAGAYLALTGGIPWSLPGVRGSGSASC